jgi:hypothetical protein
MTRYGMVCMATKGLWTSGENAYHRRRCRRYYRLSRLSISFIFWSKDGHETKSVKSVCATFHS